VRGVEAMNIIYGHSRVIGQQECHPKQNKCEYYCIDEAKGVSQVIEYVFRLFTGILIANLPPPTYTLAI